MTSPALARLADGSIALPMRLVGGAESVGITMQHRLRTHRGTDLEDITVGLPWKRWATTLPTPLADIEGVSREQARRVPGVTAARLSRAARDPSTGSIATALTVDISTRDTTQAITMVVADPLLTSGAPEWFFVSVAG